MRLSKKANVAINRIGSDQIDLRMVLFEYSAILGTAPVNSLTKRGSYTVS